MNKSCLIGHTGFVGTNLKNNMIFNDLYNTTNISKIKNQNYDFCVIAAPSAVKWKANKEPAHDLKIISSLIETLYQACFKKVVLISTVDVYGDDVSSSPNEKSDPKWNVHAYGRNRKIFETFVSEKFDCSIIRLPGLFGPGLKKNIIFDLMNDNMINNISLKTEFQWLNLQKLPKIITHCLENEITLYNVSPEPIQTSEIVKKFFSSKVLKCRGESNLKYNVKSLYSKSETGFTISKTEILNDLGNFIDKEKVL